MDISKEAGNLASHINNKVARGYRANVLADKSVRVEFSDSEQTFDIVLVADSNYNVFIPDFCPIGMNDRPKLFASRARMGYITLALAEYNLKLSKRLSK